MRHFFDGRMMTLTEQAVDAVFKAEAAVGFTDKVENGEAFLMLVQTKSAAKLLQEDGEGFRRAQEQDGIEKLEIDAFVVKVDAEYEFQFSLFEAAVGFGTLFFAAGSNQGYGRYIGLIEKIRHEAGMLDADAEAEPFDAGKVCDIAVDGVENVLATSSGIVALTV